MKTTFCYLSLAGLFLGVSAAWGWEGAAATNLPEFSFPLSIGMLDPDAKEEVPPCIVMFDGGVDDKGKDVRGPLARLEALRGNSKMFPESNKDPGLPVVLRGLRLHEKRDAAGKLAGYDIELQGEFNMVKVPVAKEIVEKFLAGEPVTFELEGNKNFGLYSYVSNMEFDLQRIGKEIYVFKASGDFRFREGFYTYTSKTKTLTPPAGRTYLFRGTQAELPALPAI